MTDKNTDSLFESLSALMDDEASELELHRILKHIETNQDLRQRWERYHVISSIMDKNRGYADSEMSLFSRVSEAVSHEETYGEQTEAQALEGNVNQVVPVEATSSSWSNMLGKTAVAVSFAAAMVFMIPALQQNGLQDQRNASGDLNFVGTDAGTTNAVDVSPTYTAPTTLATSVPEGFSVTLPEARAVSSSLPMALLNTLDQGSEKVPDTAQVNDPQLQALLNGLLVEHANRASQNGGLSILPYARVSRLDSQQSAK